MTAQWTVKACGHCWFAVDPSGHNARLYARKSDAVAHAKACNQAQNRKASNKNN